MYIYKAKESRADEDNEVFLTTLAEGDDENLEH